MVHKLELVKGMALVLREKTGGIRRLSGLRFHLIRAE